MSRRTSIRTRTSRSSRRTSRSSRRTSRSRRQRDRARHRRRPLRSRWPWVCWSASTTTAPGRTPRCCSSTRRGRSCPSRYSGTRPRGPTPLCTSRDGTRSGTSGWRSPGARSSCRRRSCRRARTPPPPPPTPPALPPTIGDLSHFASSRSTRSPRASPRWYSSMRRRAVSASFLLTTGRPPQHRTWPRERPWVVVRWRRRRSRSRSHRPWLSLPLPPRRQPQPQRPRRQRRRRRLWSPPPRCPRWALSCPFSIFVTTAGTMRR